MKQELIKELQNIVRRNYESVAKQFSETRKRRLWDGLEEILRPIPAGSRILDAGCGSGKLLMGLEGKQIEYVGVDNCPELLEQARRNYPDHDFRQGDILQLGLLPELNFDYVFAVAVLQHIPSQGLRVDALRQLKNKISGQGRIIISNWNMWSPVWSNLNFRGLYYRFALLKLIGKNRMDLGDILFDWKNAQGEVISQRYYHMFARRELKRLSRQAGLKIEKLYRDDYNYYLILRK